ncbi:metal ABC transporter substrate-binding protein [Clostridioides mangenotii]|uniref:metal ABC transporter substrate-binding protein n=1 Tax=Metaclostridioides mangenotii TaxID=1540 RepID=UPI002F423BB9
MKKFKKNCFLTMITIVLFSLLTGCNKEIEQLDSKGKELNVLTSIYPMYDFAQKIAGNKATIINMVPSGVEPHDWEPTAKDITNLEKADLFIYNGSGMEHWVEDILKSTQNEDLVKLEASKNIKLTKGHSHDKEDENHSSDNEYNENSISDPHVWMDPKNAKQEMKDIKDTFVQADPTNKEFYENNYAKYAKELDKLDKEYKEVLTPLSNKDIVVSHEAFGYLCEAYGLNQVGIEGMSPDSEPDPARISEIIKFVKENKVKVIFFEELVSPKVAKTIADATGAKTDVLNPIEGLSAKETSSDEDYFSVMRKNLESLKLALQ